MAYGWKPIAELRGVAGNQAAIERFEAIETALWNRGDLANGANVNNMRFGGHHGSYRIIDGTSAATMTGLPESSGGALNIWYLRGGTEGSTVIQQYLTEYGVDWRRRRTTDGGWTEWETVAMGSAWAPQRNVPANANLDTFKVPGVHCITTPDTQTIANVPPGMAQAGIFENLLPGTGTNAWWVQRVTQHGNSPRMWWRSTRDLVGVWNPWQESNEGGGIVTELHVFPAIGQSGMSGRGAPSGGSRDPENPRIMQYGATRKMLETATVPLDMHDTASGLSPATAFARTYLKTQPSHVGVLIVPAAHGATGFTTAADMLTWTPNAASALEFDLPKFAVDQTTAAVTAAKAAGYTVSVEGVLWHQGENNSSMSAASYATALDSLISYIRTGLGNSKLRFVVGQMVPEGIEANAGRENIDQAHRETPSRVAYTGFAPATRDGHNTGDTTHMSRIGVEFLGRTYAAALVAAGVTEDIKPRLKAAETATATIPAQVATAVPPAVASYISTNPDVVNSAVTLAQSNAGLIPKWKANTTYTAGQQVVTVDGDVVSATIGFTSGATYSAANWTSSLAGASLVGRTIPDNTDFHTLSQAGWHKSLQFAPGTVNAPWAGVRSWVHVMPMSTSNRTLLAVSYEGSPRIALKAYVSGAWGAWVYLDPAAIAALTNRVTALEAKQPTPPRPASGLKVVPLQLTLGNASQTDGALTGTYRYPMKWNAPLQRVRVNIQNVHPSSGTVKTGSVDFTGLWVGKHGANGAFATAPTQIHSAFSSPADGSKWVSKWFWLDHQAGVEDLLSIGYTAANGTVFNVNAAGWKNTDPAVAGQQSPTLTSEGMLPFYIWLEAETYATTPHIGVMGDSIASGVGAAHVQNSWLSKYCYAKGALPTHYSNSGDTLESWGTNLTHYKWNVFDGLAVPDAVIIAGGSNDLNGVKTNVEIQSYYTAVANQFRAKGVTNLYAANILPRTSGESGTFEVNRRAHNNWLTGLPGGVRELFKFRDVVSADDETLRPEYDYDGVHLNAAGYAALAASITRPVTTPPVMYATV